MKRSYSVAAVALLVSMLGAWGCVEKSTELTEAERDRISAFISTEAPTPQHPLDISFENKVELVGYDISTEELEAGQSFEVTWHWHVKRALEADWQTFTHLSDAAGADRLNQDNVGDVRELYPPGRWKADEYIRDVQRITLPADWNSDKLTIYLGLWNGPHRLQVTRGPSDDENRARVLEMDVTGGAPTPPPEAPLPSLTARRATDAVTIDGNLDEAAWGTASSTGRLVNTMTGGPAEPETSVKVLWDDDKLYVAFDVKDDFIRSSFDSRDDHLWEQDTVEIMVDPDGDGQNYFELQVSPTGVSFETRYDTARQPQPFGHVDWNPELESAVSVRGTANDDESDEGYTVEIAIPWASFVNGDAEGTKPELGQTWRINFFLMDARQGDAPMRTAGWSPPRVGDFHTLNRFGRVVFGDAEGAVPEAAAEAQADVLEVPPTITGSPAPVQAGQQRPLLQLPPGVLQKIQGQQRDPNRLRSADQRDQAGPNEATPTAESPGPTGN